MLKNGQTYFKNLAVFIHSVNFLKHIWPFFNMMKEKVKVVQSLSQFWNTLREGKLELLPTLVWDYLQMSLLILNKFK